MKTYGLSGGRFPLALLVLSLFAATAAAQKELPISAVQGDKNISSVEGQQVRVSGIVTARIRSGFFIQTPDTKVDANPATSEGIFVFTKIEPPTPCALR